jgi:hypothetical protein
MLAICLVFTCPASAAPKIQIDEYVYNAGSLPQGKTIVHGFIIKNIGDRPLEVTTEPC